MSLRSGLSLVFFLAALALASGIVGCDGVAYEDAERYVFVEEAKETVSQCIGLACDAQHTCAPGVECWIPSECRVASEDKLHGGPGGKPGDGCDDDTPCMESAHCEPVSSISLCSSRCESDHDCPDANVCWLGGGAAHGRCVRPGGLPGARCSAENDCHPGLTCENRAQSGYCTRPCDSRNPCPEGMGAVCTALDDGMGTLCLKRCDSSRAGTCDSHTSCQELTDTFGVCLPSF